MTRRLARLTAALAAILTAEGNDWRDIRNGWVIPDESYADQPYIVITRDGNWLCVMTTGKGVEGQPGQHIVSTVSRDKGRTWSAPVDIEPADGPEASWVMPLLVPSGRVYVFYTYNKDNVREIPGVTAAARRVDTLGGYMFKYSDDNGRTWSRERYEIPMRKMRIDRENSTLGHILFFWGVGKPILTPEYAIFGFAKVGKWGNPGVMVESQGCFLRSENILTEGDPAKIRWTLLPDGDEGLRAPKGPVSDEANLVMLGDGSLYATYRTIDGYNAHAYSRDRGHSWTPPAYATYSPGGRRIKHPRAANFVRKFSNGKYLLWFHNHGGEAVHDNNWTDARGNNFYYRNRNPGWILGGVERNGQIHWSQPEILLYDEDPAVRISYPDFVEDGGEFYVTETQKEMARVHKIDKSLLEAVWGQHDNRARTKDWIESGEMGGSFTIEFWMRLRELTAGQTILDTRDASGKGIAVTTSQRFTLELTMSDGQTSFSWDSDPGTHPGTLRSGVWQHAAIVVDGGPRIVSFVVDGEFNDGGAARQFGWTRFPKLRGLGLWTPKVPRVFGEIKELHVYNRALRISEVVGNYRAGL